MGHVGQEFAFRLAGRKRGMHRLFQVRRALADAILEQFLVQSNLFLGGRKRLDHPVKALAEVFDFIAGRAHLDRLKPSLADRNNAGLQ